jgi:hypothetical protein
MAERDKLKGVPEWKRGVGRIFAQHEETIRESIAKNIEDMGCIEVWGKALFPDRCFDEEERQPDPHCSRCPIDIARRIRGGGL